MVVDIELPAGGVARRSMRWPRPARAPSSVLFVDGVRRIDARVWIDGDSPGICASYAAGAVRCDGRAEVVDIAVARGMFSTAATAADIVTRHATYPARMAGSNDIAALMLAVHERMTDVEVGIAGRVDGADLVVIDGPLRARHTSTMPSASSRATPCATCPRSCTASWARSAAGQRTPVFTVGVDVEPALVVPAVAGTVGMRRGRASCGASARPISRPQRRSSWPNMTAAVLPRFASEPHKDTRAPQNLYPIGGLERELRHRLGDQALLFRSLQRAAATA